MAINKLNIGLISNTASDGNEGVTDQHVLTYVAANNSVEFKELSLTVAGVGTVSSNADAVNTQLTANIDTVQDNVTSTVSLLSSSNTNIDTVQANLDTFATYANTNYAADAANSFSTITVGSSNVVATTTTDNVIFATGNGISILANADAQSLTFSMYAGDIKSDYFTLDGTANTVTLSTDNRPDYTLYVTVGGLIQEPGINYIVNSTTLTLNNTYPILNGTDVEVRYLPYTGEIAAATPTYVWAFQGTTSGYVMGGATFEPLIQKFSLVSDSPASDVGELLSSRDEVSGNGSDTSGYVVGNNSDTIEKFPFSSDTSSTDVGEMVTTKRYSSGQSSSTHGYASGSVSQNSIEKFPFSSDTPATDVGELSVTNWGTNGHSSTTDGYVTGGNTPSTVDNIEKFPFSSDTSATNIASLTVIKGYAAGISSSTHGYTAGGNDPVGSPVYLDSIDKFSFSSDGNATDVGEMATGVRHNMGISSTTNGYSAGGAQVNAVNNIEKFPFASDTSAIDIAELLSTKQKGTGTQI